MENRHVVWETKEYSDTQFEIRIDVDLLKNNLGQILSDLIGTYKFYYSGLSISESEYLKFKHSVELNLVFSEKPGFDIVTKNAANHLSQAYLKDIVEVVNFELVEVCLILFLVEQRNKGYGKTVVDKKIGEHRDRLKKEPCPNLIKMVEESISELSFKKHLLSINSIRRVAVHYDEIVDRDAANLITRTMKIFTRSDFTEENRAAVGDDMQFDDFTKTWKKGERIILEYEDCFRIQMTVLMAFNEIVNKMYLKYPFLKKPNGN